MLRLEDLLLANLIVRRGFANPFEVQTALSGLDRAPGRGDLLGGLAARGGPLAHPQAREQAISGVRRFVLQRAEQIMASRLRQAGVLPPAALDDLVARQRAEGTKWTLADRLAQEGRLDPARRAALEADAARDLEAYGAQLVARHRVSNFAETVAMPPGSPGGPSLATSSEVLRALDPEPVGAPDSDRTLRLPPMSAASALANPGLAPPAGSDDDAGEVTMKIPPPAAHLMRPPTRGAVPIPTVAPGPAWNPPQGLRPQTSPPFASPIAEDPSGRTVALPPHSGNDGRGLSPSGNGADDPGGQTMAFPPPSPGAPLAGSGAAPPDATVRLGEGASSGAAVSKPRKPAGPLAPGAVLGGKLEVVDELGRGGMGVVYRARSRDLGYEVALKVVPSQGAATKEILPRFKREILTASRVKHENVCAVLDHGDAQGLAWMAMELIEGESLRDLVDREAPLASDRALGILTQILHGLEACHEAKVIHRDLKPDNVRIARVSGRELAKLVDFGIARLLDQDAVNGEEVFMTMKGVLSGTPSYVAPELIMDDELVSARADVYAVGVVFYELLTGKLPFPAKTLREILKETVETAPTPLRDALPDHTVPPGVERVLFRMLEKDPLVRFGTPREVLDALEEAKNPPRVERTGFTARLVKRITRLFGKV